MEVRPGYLTDSFRIFLSRLVEMGGGGHFWSYFYPNALNLDFNLKIYNNAAKRRILIGYISMQLLIILKCRKMQRSNWLKFDANRYVITPHWSFWRMSLNKWSNFPRSNNLASQLWNKTLTRQFTSFLKAIKSILLVSYKRRIIF